MIIGKKARKEAARKEKAIRRMRLQTFIALLIPVMAAWQIGVKGGGYDGDIYYRPVDVSPEQRRYILMQAGRINKARDVLVRECMGLEAFNTGKSFFRTADEKLHDISYRIFAELPESQTRADYMTVLTYILYAALHDYRELEDDTRSQLRKLEMVLGQLANHLMPAGSPLCGPMNNVYWATRDDMQATTDWTLGGTLNWQPSEDEKAMGIA